MKLFSEIHINVYPIHIYTYSFLQNMNIPPKYIQCSLEKIKLKKNLFPPTLKKPVLKRRVAGTYGDFDSLLLSIALNLPNNSHIDKDFLIESLIMELLPAYKI